MTVPFIRQYPGERRGLTEISLFPAVEKLAHAFIANGGRYLIEILPSGRVRLAACLLTEEGHQIDVEEREADNGPPAIAAVNDLIEKSIDHLPSGRVN